jgi:hypothetical protein
MASAPNAPNSPSAPKGPYPDESTVIGMAQLDKIKYTDAGGILDSIVTVLVIPFPMVPVSWPLGAFDPYRTEIEQLHKEVNFCLWSMHISLSVYMKLLYRVDINVRHEISNVVGRFLADWRDERGPALFDALDALIISEFVRYSLVDIPDMNRLQRSKDCETIRSTVAAYIKDIAMKLLVMREGDLESTIEVLFPSSSNFIGRCFFTRLAAVASTLLDLMNGFHGFEAELDSADSLCSTRSS